MTSCEKCVSSPSFNVQCYESLIFDDFVRDGCISDIQISTGIRQLLNSPVAYQ
jgi:hypothetical protein